MTADHLRERLVAAYTSGLPPFEVLKVATLVDLAVSVFAEHVSSDATVERVARAQARAEAANVLTWTWEGLGSRMQQRYLDHARAGLAALAAALVAEGEASNGA